MQANVLSEVHSNNLALGRILELRFPLTERYLLKRVVTPGAGLPTQEGTNLAQPNFERALEVLVSLINLIPFYPFHVLYDNLYLRSS